MDRSIYFVGFFRFDARGPEWGFFKRIDLHAIHETLGDISDLEKANFYFDDEAGWYEGVLVEERFFGHQNHRKGYRRWYLQMGDRTLKEIVEPTQFSNIVNLI